MDHIVKELATEKYSRKQIQGICVNMWMYIPFTFYDCKDGARIYRKTLKESLKGRPEEVQDKARIRSRQQQVNFYIVL